MGGNRSNTSRRQRPGIEKPDQAPHLDSELGSVNGDSHWWVLHQAFHHQTLVRDLAAEFLDRYRKLSNAGAEAGADARLHRLHGQLWMAVKAHQRGVTLRREDLEGPRH